MENLVKDADDVVSVVSYIRKIMFYILCYSNETTMAFMATPTPLMWAILTSNDDKRNFIYRQLHRSY